jgi:inner membrane transporter RhtA
LRLLKSIIGTLNSDLAEPLPTEQIRHSEPLDIIPSPLLVLGAIGSVQIGASIATHLFSRLTPSGTVFVRVFVGGVILLAVTRPRWSLGPRQNIGMLVFFGLVIAAMNLSFYQAIARVPLGICVTIEFLGPLAIAIFGSRRAVDFLWAILAGSGVILLTRGGGAIVPLGVFFAALAGVGWAAYILLNQRVGRLFPGSGGLAIAMTIGGLALAPIGVYSAGANLVNPVLLLPALGVSLLSSAIPFSLEFAALRRLPSQVFSILMSLEPACAALAGLLLIGQRLQIVQVAAIVMVMVASVGATLTRPSGQN